MALVGDQEMRLKHFRTIWQFCYPRAKILITGRPNFFLDDKEMKAALGISKPNADGPYSEAIRLAPFGPGQIARSLRRQEALVREQICALVEKNPGFSDLVSRPSLLHIVSVLWAKERLSEKVDHLTPASLIEIFVRHSYRRQGLKEAGSPDFMALTTSERQYFMRGIATFMAAEALPNRISVMQLNTLIEDLIRVIPDSVSDESTALSGESRRPLRARLAETEDAIEHVKTDVRACGLLVDDAAAPGTFKFGHKSFMEYLFAAVLSEQVLRDEAAMSTIMKVTGARFADVLKLPVSVEFLSQLMGAGARPEPCQGKRNIASFDTYQRSRILAKRLLGALVGRKRVSFIFARTSLFIRAYLASISRLSYGRRILFLFITVMPIFISTILIMEQTLLEHENASRLIMYLSVIFMIGYMTALTGALRVAEAGARLWNVICLRLEMPDDVLHQVIGTSVLPWTKGRPFDYFLERGAGSIGEAGEPEQG